jgi:prophage tail gpP-like protein
LIEHDSDVDSQAEASRRARKRIADSRLEGLTIEACVRGHRTGDGEPWRPGQRVRLVSEPHGLDGIYFLMKRSFLGGRDRGTITELTLKEDGVWLPDLATSSKKSKGKKTLTVVDL